MTADVPPFSSTIQSESMVWVVNRVIQVNASFISSQFLVVEPKGSGFLVQQVLFLKKARVFENLNGFYTLY